MNINNFGLLNTLFGIINNGEQDNDYAVAAFLLRNIDRVKDLSVNEVIDQAYTTRSAVRRFCQRIGYDNFSQFKQSITQIIFPSNLTYRQFSTIHDYRKQRSFEIQTMVDDINTVMTDEQIGEIATLLHQYERVLLVCANNSSGDLVRFQQELLFANKIVSVVSDSYTANNRLNAVDEETLLLLVSTSGTFALEANQWLQSLPGHKILITGNTDPRFKQTYDQIYWISQQHIENDFSGVYGKYGMTYLFDLIAEYYLFQFMPKK